MNTFYLQVNSDNIITDAISYPYGDYVEYVSDGLPSSVNGGWFKFENGIIVEYPALKPISPEVEIDTLKMEIASIQEVLDFLLMGGV